MILNLMAPNSRVEGPACNSLPCHTLPFPLTLLRKLVIRFTLRCWTLTPAVTVQGWCLISSAPVGAKVTWHCNWAVTPDPLPTAGTEMKGLKVKARREAYHSKQVKVSRTLGLLVWNRAMWRLNGMYRCFACSMRVLVIIIIEASFTSKYGIHFLNIYILNKSLFCNEKANMVYIFWTFAN